MQNILSEDQNQNEDKIKTKFGQKFKYGKTIVHTLRQLDYYGILYILILAVFILYFYRLLIKPGI